MSKYTAEQVSDLADRLELNAQDRYGALHGVRCESAAAILRDYAAHLREREAAKAGVTEEMDMIALAAYDAAGPAMGIVKMHAALEAVAPLLSVQVPDVVTPVHAASGLNASERHAWALGWNDCRDAMLAAAPKRGEG